MNKEIIRVTKGADGIVEEVIFKEKDLDVAFRAMISTIFSFCAEYGVTISDLVMSLILSTDNLLSTEEVISTIDPNMVGDREMLNELAEAIADKITLNQHQSTLRS